MANRKHRDMQESLFLSLTLLVLISCSSITIVASTSAGRSDSIPSGVQGRGVPRFPDVSATQIVFLFAGELWLVPREGGVATLLTTGASPRSSPKFSPDGHVIAFTGRYDGIYTVPVSGGPATRVTHQPGATDLCNWTPDGRLLFMTDTFFPPGDFGEQAYLRQLLVVPATGGLPNKLPVPYGANGAISADGQWLAYTPYAEGRSEHKMHYRGGLAPDILLFNLRSHQSSKITDWAGTDTAPMWHGETVFYLSDAGAEQRRNIWSYQLKSGKRRQITHFKDFDVKWPSIGPGPNGEGEIVFVSGTELYLLDLATEAEHIVDVAIPEGYRNVRPRGVDAGKFVTNWNPSPDGTKAVVEARGDLWIVSSQGESRNVTQTSGAAERYPVWSPDGRWIAYSSDVSGEYQLYIVASDGTGAPQQLTHLGASFRFWPAWAPDSQRIAFSDSAGGIYIRSLQSGETKTVHQDPVVRQPQLSWSPDSAWLAFNGSADSQQVIWLYDVTAGQAHQVTGGGYNDKWPTFDRVGDYVFFVSDRNYDPLTYDSVDYSNFIYPSTELVMALPLRSDLPAPGQSRNRVARHPSDGPPKHIIVDFDNIERRAVVVASEAGKYWTLVVALDGNLLYTFSPTGAAPSIKMLDFADSPSSGMREPKTILAGSSDFRLSGDGKRLLVRKNGAISVVDPAPNQQINESIKLVSMTAGIDPRAEWRQIFADAWRLYRDFFYDPAMRGVDWPAMRDKYAKLLEACANREDVDYVIGEMLGELGSSHVYLNPPPNEEPPAEAVGMLGVDFDLDHGAYRIVKIYDAAPSDTAARNPLRQPGVDVKEGDYLLAVDGKPLDTREDPWAAFKGLAGKDVTLTVSSKPVLDQEARKTLVQPGSIEVLYRHRDWVEANRAYVERKTGGRVGYLYLKMTSEYGFREFTRQFGPQLGKEALIIDARWNQGGHIPYHLLDILRRHVYFYSVDMRRTISQPGPGYVLNGPKCVLINSVTQSGGDLLAYLVQQSGAAKLIGTRTMGAMAGAGGLMIPFIDGGYSLVPTVGFFDLKGKWTVEGYGVRPDVEVPDDPASMANGGDPQLDKAIELMMDELRRMPPGPRVQPPSGRAGVLP